MRVSVDATGIGRTVQNVIEGNLGDDPDYLPRVHGHELVGTVDEAGVGVTHLDEGERVTAYFHIVCGHCQACRSGHDSLCENHERWISVDTNGGFAEYACLPARNVIGIPESIAPAAATVIPDAFATPYHVANQRANIERGDNVVVFGQVGASAST